MNDSLKTPRPVPGWASFFTADQYAIFLILVEADLRQRGFSIEMHDGVVYARLKEEQPHHLGLQNLAQMCLSSAESTWEHTIDKHFSLVTATVNDGADTPFSELRDQLKVRLYADEFPDDIRLIRYDVAPGIAAVLTLDLPDTVVTVSPHRADAWGQSHRDLLDLGLANALADAFEQGTIDSVGGPIQVLESDSFFVATQALRLEAWVPHDHPHGALVAVPNRHIVIFHAIEGMEMVSVVNDMLFHARNLFRRGPGSISPDLFWWRSGEFTLLPSFEDAGKLTFSPPMEFVDCLEQLLQSPS